MLCLFSIIIVLSSLLEIMTSLPERYGFHFMEWALDKNQKVVGYSYIIYAIIVPVNVSTYTRHCFSLQDSQLGGTDDCFS